MNKWFSEYQDLMRRTRVVSAAGASLAVVAVGLDLYGLFSALSVAEVSPLDDSQLAWNTGKRLFLLLVVAAVFVLRIIILSLAGWTPYRKFVASWFLAVTIAIGYVWLTNEASGTPAPDCAPGEGEICFGFYDMSNSFEWVRMIAVLYLPVSALRSLATGLWAAVKNQYK